MTKGHSDYEKADQYLGMGVQEAEAQALREGRRVRILPEASTGPITADLDRNRVNLFVSDGVVVRAVIF